MAVYRLLDDFEEDNDFIILAIHSYLEDYRVAYFLNKYLGAGFIKAKAVTLSSDKVFQCYEWIDKKNDIQWNLIQNYAIRAKKNITDTLLLFGELEKEEKIYLIPEQKKVDFFIKINAREEYIDIKKTLQQIQQIPDIQTTYKLAANQIKTRTNLIF